MELETSVLVEQRQLRHRRIYSQPPWGVYQAPRSGRICAESMVLLRYILLGIMFDKIWRINFIFIVDIEWILLMFWTIKATRLCQLKGLVGCGTFYRRARQKLLVILPLPSSSDIGESPSIYTQIHIVLHFQAHLKDEHLRTFPE